MATNNPMTVITSKPFGALNVDVYQNDKHQYYMTREQIGAALEPVNRLARHLSMEIRKSQLVQFTSETQTALTRFQP